MIYIIYKKCPECNGTGKDNNDGFCVKCKGIKKIKEEVTAQYPPITSTNEEPKV
jgi:DnaJ-class molecular chaperone